MTCPSPGTRFCLALVITTLGFPLSLIGSEALLDLDFTPGSRWSRDDHGVITVQGREILPRIEGQGSAADQITLITDPDPLIGHALHYLVTGQTDGKKARLEHYLATLPMRTTLVSEFSLRLDPDFTPAEAVRPDGGPNWVILRQWHQSAPESPALSIFLKHGTNDTLTWRIFSGGSKADAQPAIIGEYVVHLGEWTHFRMVWNICPPQADLSTTGLCQVYASPTVPPDRLDASHLRITYRGPIGYADRPGHDGEQVREQQGVYQGPHAHPPVRHGVAFDNVRIYRAP